MSSVRKDIKKIIAKVSFGFSSGPKYEIDPEYIAAPVPKILWIELTSKCPFDCVFCSRKLRRGDGEHMDFELYKSVLRELQDPEVIRLNYSGESIHYPHIVQAIELAKATGATTELVSAFSSIPPTLLPDLVQSGLDRLTVSLHTMDPVQYKNIYRFSSLDLLKSKIETLIKLKQELKTQTPKLDFAFVAMKDNLDQLSPVVDYARELGVSDVFIHPVIRRDPIAHDFSAELTLQNKLTDTFKTALRGAQSRAQAKYPEVNVTVSNPDIDAAPCLGHGPRYFPAPLPKNARISTCDQSPWDTVHILANGDVVACEVHDKVPLGNLKQSPLSKIWRDEKYRQFRQGYVTGAMAECRECPWKWAYLPSPLKSSIVAADGMSYQLLRGWHAPPDGDIVWSKRESLIVLGSGWPGRRVRLQGVLPHAPDGPANFLQIDCNGRALGRVVNASDTLLSFDVFLDRTGPQTNVLNLKLTTRAVFRPSRWGLNNDDRELGFALARIEVL